MVRLNLLGNTKVSQVMVLSALTFFFACEESVETDWSQKWGERKTVGGYVFNDNNRNGTMEEGEKRIPGVIVSNQREVVRTDVDGYYSLPVDSQNIFFVTKPAGYNPPVDENNLPLFYYIHQPQGSPNTLAYPGVSPTGDIPEQLNFPLYKGRRHDRFKAMIVGDPQPASETHIGYLRDEFVSKVAGSDAAFYLALGDVVWDNLDLYAPYVETVGKIGIPVYSVPGNHDMNYNATDDRFSLETFKRQFGPEYYSFEYGRVHFIVLDDVEWFGKGGEENYWGRYRGRLGDRQLTWLKNDVDLVPEDKLIVLAMHIPIESETDRGDGNTIYDRDRFLEILEERRYLLAFAGHTHTIEHVFLDSTAGWHGAAEFHHIIAGAICGAWWNGPKDLHGIPVGIGVDGSPNGYYEITFTDNRYESVYFPVRRGRDFQMRIISPVGSIHADSLNGVRVIANLFDATKDALVRYRLDDSEPVEMKRTLMLDPFTEKVRKENDDYFKSWIYPHNSTHIWIAPLDSGITPGVHRLSVNAVNRDGREFTGSSVFRIIEPDSLAVE